MALLYANNAESTLASGISAGATAITLATGDGAKFPTPGGGDYFKLTLAPPADEPETAWEIVHVTARSGDALTVTRAQEGTTAQVWSAGAKAELRLTKATMEALQVAGDDVTTGYLKVADDAGAFIELNLTGGGANSTLIRSATVNGASIFRIVPNGTSASSGVFVYNAADILNASSARVQASATASALNSAAFGTGTVLPWNFQISGLTYGQLFTTGRWGFGSGATDDGISTVSVNGLTSIIGSLSLTGAARRFFANMSDATPANRFAFQTNATDSATTVSVIPSGTSQISQFRAVNTSAYTNGAVGSFGITSASVYIDCGFIGSGSALPFDLAVNGTARFRMFTAGRFFFGASPADDGTNMLQVAGSAKVQGLTSISASAGIGYGAGAGASATQGAGSGKATAVTLNAVCGQITMNNAALNSDTAVSFTLSNTAIAANDEVRVWIKSGATTGGSYLVQADSVSAGSCRISVRNLTGGSLSEALVLGFNVFKSVTA